MENNNRQRLAIEAKAIVALAFRNGPIEGIHAGTQCPTCSGEASYSRITDAEIKEIMSSAVNRVYDLLLLKAENPQEYGRQIVFGTRYTLGWDDPPSSGDLG